MVVITIKLLLIMAWSSYLNSCSHDANIITAVANGVCRGGTRTYQSCNAGVTNGVWRGDTSTLIIIVCCYSWCMQGWWLEVLALLLAHRRNWLWFACQLMARLCCRGTRVCNLWYIHLSMMEMLCIHDWIACMFMFVCIHVCICIYCMHVFMCMIMRVFSFLHAIIQTTSRWTAQLQKRVWCADSCHKRGRSHNPMAGMQ